MQILFYTKIAFTAMKNPTLTIFTPTYNRAYILPKLYASLKRQNIDDFEWVIVDDGSTDNTKDLVDIWIKEDNTFSIKYEVQENAGKMAAHNRGVELAHGELFLCVDSDDYISDNCVELILKEWCQCKDNSVICGVLAYKFLKNGVQNSFPEGDCMSLFELYEKGFTGDTTIVMKTEVFREFPFPIIKGEKFITEGYVYDQISQKYKLRILREYLTICEYLPDGYTNNAIKLYKNNPGGWALKRKQDYIIRKGFKISIKNMAEYIMFSRQYGKGFVSILADSPNRIVCLILYPLGLYQDYKYRYIIYRNVL